MSAIEAILKACGRYRLTGGTKFLLGETELRNILAEHLMPDEKMIDIGLSATASWLDIKGSALTVNREKMRRRYLAMLGLYHPVPAPQACPRQTQVRVRRKGATRTRATPGNEGGTNA